jgi:hypothetical protein
MYKYGVYGSEQGNLCATVRRWMLDHSMIVNELHSQKDARDQQTVCSWPTNKKIRRLIAFPPEAFSAHLRHGFTGTDRSIGCPAPLVSILSSVTTFSQAL